MRSEFDKGVIVAERQEYHNHLLRLLAAFFIADTVKGAAALVGMGEQTAKNMLLDGRRRMHAKNNDELLRINWRAITRHPLVLEELGLSERKMRYHFDDEYRERAKKQARDGMQKKRAAQTKGLRVHYDRLLAVQGNVCAICHTPEGTRSRRGYEHAVRLSVDHDHKTGAIRELLCSACNLMLGYSKDSAERLQAGADYLRKHAQTTSHNNDSEAA